MYIRGKRISLRLILFYHLFLRGVNVGNYNTFFKLSLFVSAIKEPFWSAARDYFKCDRKRNNMIAEYQTEKSIRKIAEQNKCSASYAHKLISEHKQLTITQIPH